MSRLLWLAFFFAAACSGEPARRSRSAVLATSTGASPNPSVALPPGPPVLVTIVVDQLAGWIADERWPELPKGGGFARLRREGTWFKEMRYAHAATDTAPGHSALYTATTPRESGIFANEIPDGKGGRLSFLRDEAAHVISEAGEEASPAASLKKLRVDTLADVLVRTDPSAIVLAFSLKDRGALFGAGRSPRSALWFDPKNNRIVTSTAVARALPSWALSVASSSALKRTLGGAWSLLDPAWVAAHAKTPDDQPGEGDEKGFGRVFPHVLLSAKEPGYGLRTSPLGDELLFALALAGIDGEKVAGHHALVTLSLSANDYVGHVFGPDSWEAWDELESLDRSLGNFLEALDARFGRDGYAVLLSADHGVTTMPEATLVPGVRGYCEGARRETPDPWGRPCGSVGRLFAEALHTELEAATEKALGPGHWVEGVVDPFVYLTSVARALEGKRRDLLDETISRALRVHPEVDDVTPTRALPSTCPPESDESIAALVCRSVPEGAGDYYVVPRRGSFFDANVVVGKGSSHGSPYVFDRAVPLLVRAPGRVVAGAVVTNPVGFETFARAGAALLSIGAPGHAALGADLVVPDLRLVKKGAPP